MANNKIMCNCDLEKVRNDVEEESFARTLIKEYAKQSKRWFIVAIIILIMWLGTIGGFLLYLDQYNFSSTSVEATQDGEGVNIVNGGDLTYGAESENNG